MPRSFLNQVLSLDQARFLFVLCPNNSGSTILSQFIAAQLDAYLPPYGNFEGQMAPDVKPMMRFRAWDPAQGFDWGFIRKAWERLAEGRLFVEASPPNIIRTKQIEAVFGQDSLGLLSLCSPYQQIASSLRRYRRPGTRPETLVEQWVEKARCISVLRDQYPWFPFIRHEDFITEPGQVSAWLGVPQRPIVLKGKRGSGEGLQDLRAVTTLFLSPEEIDAVSDALVAHDDLLASLGYALTSGAELYARLADDAEALKGAQARRREWEEFV